MHLIDKEKNIEKVDRWLKEVDKDKKYVINSHWKM